MLGVETLDLLDEDDKDEFDGARRLRFDDSLVMAMGQMSPEGRVGLAETLRRRRP